MVELGIDEEDITMGIILEKATEDEKKWLSFKKMCRDILREKTKIEKQREMEGIDTTAMRTTTLDLESGNLDRIRDL